MEKLQAALEKARASRQTGAPAKDVSRAKPARKPAPSGTEPWQNIQEIPLSGRALFEHRIVTQQASEKTAHFDILRTKVLLQMQQNGWKRLAITSPMPKCGKTTTACNLALGLGRQSGLKAMLFDLDLKDPSIAGIFGHHPEHPISDMLSGKTDFADQAVRVGETVTVSMSEQIVHDPTQVLLSPKTEETLDAVQAAYDPDIMIFDVPSILVSDNTRAFLKNVDCALIIARANETRYGHFDTCEREVAEHTNVLGVILNAFRAKNVENSIDR